MTHEQANAEAERRQHSHPDAKWIATRRGEEWVVARIGLSPASTMPTGTAIQPPPPIPRDDPQSPLQRVSTLYGAGG